MNKIKLPSGDLVLEIDFTVTQEPDCKDELIKDLKAVVKEALKLTFHYKGEILDIDHANRFEDFAYSMLHKVGKHE